MSEIINVDKNTVAPVKRGRGRPKKNVDINATPVIRGKGRPKKNDVVETKILEPPVPKDDAVEIIKDEVVQIVKDAIIEIVNDEAIKNKVIDADKIMNVRKRIIRKVVKKNTSV